LLGPALEPGTDDAVGVDRGVLAGERRLQRVDLGHAEAARRTVECATSDAATEASSRARSSLTSPRIDWYAWAAWSCARASWAAVTRACDALADELGVGVPPGTPARRASAWAWWAAEAARARRPTSPELVDARATAAAVRAVSVAPAARRAPTSGSVREAVGV